MFEALATGLPGKPLNSIHTAACVALQTDKAASVNGQGGRQRTLAAAAMCINAVASKCAKTAGDFRHANHNAPQYFVTQCATPVRQHTAPTLLYWQGFAKVFQHRTGTSRKPNAKTSSVNSITTHVRHPGWVLPCSNSVGAYVQKTCQAGTPESVRGTWPVCQPARTFALHHR
jgi:hypothetical protein